jgi:hypothetical protein
MKRLSLLLWLSLLVGLSCAFASSSVAQEAPGSIQKNRVDGITAPKEHFGFNIGDDYCLANYKQLEGYWKKLATQSDRIKVVKMGVTEEGRDQLMAVVTSSANHARLASYQDIARKLALAKVDQAAARQLADEGKAVVWIDGGLHASEVLCAQVLIETVYQMLSRTDPETMRFLDDVIILFVHCNPDGMDLCADWYMRNQDPQKRSSAGLPVLYEKYAGHDNNRDFYAANLRETRNMNRVMYREWFPQIIYNHHQTGPAGTVMFIPPCRDPFNYNIDPMVIGGIEAVSTAMVLRFLEENKPGVTVRTGARYSTWFNGGLSTACQFHNMIGLFTETIGGPTPGQVPLLTNKLLPNSDYLAPIPPQTWHFRQSVDYSVTANKAILDYASRNRQHLLFNIWRMGKNAIDVGNRDHWSITPKAIAAANAARTAAAATPVAAGDQANQGAVAQAEGQLGRGRGAGQAAPANQAGAAGQGQAGAAGQPGQGGRSQGRGGRGGANGVAEFARLFRDPAKRDPRGYILPSDQPDFITATRFVNKLIGAGVTVHRATASFTVAGKTYPHGSYVVKCAQAFRGHILDMFEPQDHPDDFSAGTKTPTPPYDMAGWTLAFQMGVKFDRILEAIDGPFQELQEEIAPPASPVVARSTDVGYFLDTRANASFRAVNRLLAAGEEVGRLKQQFGVNGAYYPPGTFYVKRKSGTDRNVDTVARRLGVHPEPTALAPEKECVALKPVRVALWDRYGGSMPSGWTRQILENFDFPHKVVFAPELDKGDLRSKYDVIVLVEGAIGGGRGGAGGRGGPGAGAGAGRGGRGGAGDAAGGQRGPGGGDQAPGGEGSPATRDQDLPEPYRGRQGNITTATTLPQLKKFLESGGTIVALGGSTALANQLGLPLKSHLVEKSGNEERALSREKFYVPGSVLQMRVDKTNPLTWGLDEHVDVMFQGSPTFKLPSGAEAKGLERVSWFDSKKPLRSGWAWGQEHLDGGVAIADAPVGKGKLVLCGPQILFRGQSDGAFKFLFNSIVQAGVKE